MGSCFGQCVHVNQTLEDYEGISLCLVQRLLCGAITNTLALVVQMVVSTAKDKFSVVSSPPGHKLIHLCAETATTGLDTFHTRTPNDLFMCF